MSCEGEPGETVYTRRKLAKEEEERQERGKGDALPFGQTVHQHLLHQEHNKKHASGPGSGMLSMVMPLGFPKHDQTRPGRPLCAAGRPSTCRLRSPGSMTMLWPS